MADENNQQWAIVEIMGHVQTAGRISRPGDWGVLLRVDVPDGETFRTEYYGMATIYSVKLVSEEIARAYANRVPDSIDYDAPIVTRAQHQAAMERASEQLRHFSILERTLTAVNALPDPRLHKPMPISDDAEGDDLESDADGDE